MGVGEGFGRPGWPRPWAQEWAHSANTNAFSFINSRYLWALMRDSGELDAQAGRAMDGPIPKQSP